MDEFIKNEFESLEKMDINLLSKEEMEFWLGIDVRTRGQIMGNANQYSAYTGQPLGDCRILMIKGQYQDYLFLKRMQEHLTSLKKDELKNDELIVDDDDLLLE